MMDEHGIVLPRSQALVDMAYEFAKKAHGNQKRKYTGEPYVNHPVAVAKIVMEVFPDVDCVCAALLHDVIEDTDATYQDLIDAGFMFPIADLVRELSDVSKPEDGNRATRKEIDRQHTAKASGRGKTVKLADLINNTDSITQYDPNFAKVYMNEKRKLLQVLKGGNSELMERALKLVSDYYLANPEPTGAEQ